MHVGITAFRSNMSHLLNEIKSGGEIILTHRNRPVARITGISVAQRIEQLEREGLVTPPRSKTRIIATGRKRVPIKGSLSDIIIQHRSGGEV